MNYLRYRITKFPQELKGGPLKDQLIQHQVIISEIAFCERCSYFPLPKELRN